MENKLLNAKKPRFGIGEAALASMLFIVYSFLFGLILSLAFPKGIQENSFVMFVIQFVVEVLFAVAAITVALGCSVNFVKATGINKRFNYKMVFYGCLIAFVSMIAFGNLTNVFMETLYALGYQSRGDIAINNVWQYIGYIIALCITPAVCEELLFRGTILSGLKSYGIKVAVIVSSLIFTFMHGSPDQTIHQMVVGVITGYLFFKSGNLWIGIIIHFFNNFIAVTQAFALSIAGIEATSEPYSFDLLNYLISILVAVAFAVAGYFVVKKLLQLMLKENALLNKEAVESTDTIKVDGEEVETQIIVDGGENAASSDIAEAAENNTFGEKKPISTITVVLFSLSACYLAFEWIGALLQGLGIV